MNEQYNSCGRTGERKALGALVCLMPLIVPIVRGLWLQADILPYNIKKGTKGDTNLTWLKSWNSEQYGHIILITAEHSRKTLALPKHKIAIFMCDFHFYINIKCSYIKKYR